MSKVNTETATDINEIILLKLLCERSEQHLASAHAVLHTNVGGLDDSHEVAVDNIRHILDLVAMEMKMLNSYVDYKAGDISF